MDRFPFPLEFSCPHRNLDDTSFNVLAARSGTVLPGSGCKPFAGSCSKCSAARAATGSWQAPSNMFLWPGSVKPRHVVCWILMCRCPCSYHSEHSVPWRILPSPGPAVGHGFDGGGVRQAVDLQPVPWSWLSESPFEESMAKLIAYSLECFHWVWQVALLALWGAQQDGYGPWKDAQGKSCKVQVQNGEISHVQSCSKAVVWRASMAQSFWNCEGGFWLLCHCNLMWSQQYTFTLLNDDTMLEHVMRNRFVTTEPCFTNSFRANRGGKSHSKPLLWDVAMFESNPTGIQL